MTRMQGIKSRLNRVVGAVALLGLLAVLPVLSATAGPGDGFVKWTEPKEKSFSADVPRGWKVVGGLVRPAPLDLREYVVALSPQKDALVQLGDPGVPTFITVGAADQQLGYSEGQSRDVLGTVTEVYMHFMSANEFNRWYVQNRLSQSFNNVQILVEKDMPQVAQNATASARRTAPAGKFPVVSAGFTTFKGIDKETGKPIAGVVMTTTQLMNANNGPYGSVWIASPTIVGSEVQANGEPTPAVGKMLMAAFQRMTSTRRENPVWLAKEMKRQTQVRLAATARDKATTARKLAQIKDAGERSRFIASHNRATGGGSMDAYWQRRAAQDEHNHQFLNYLRSEHDVTDEEGQRRTVPNYP